MQTVRDIATHSADIRHLRTDLDKIAKDVEEIKTAIIERGKTLAEAKGGWKLMVMVGGIGASVATFVAWVVDMFDGKLN